MRFLGRSFTALFLLAITAGLLAWAALMMSAAFEARNAESHGGRPARERVFTVEVQRIEPQSITPVATSFGEVVSARTLEIRAATPGRIVEMAAGFKNGGRVSAGDLLLRIDPAEAQSTLARAEAALAQAQSRLAEVTRSVGLAQENLGVAEAQANLRGQALLRQQDLQKRGVGTEAAIETAALAEAAAQQTVVSRRQALAEVEASVEQAQSALAEEKIRVADAKRVLTNTEVRADFDGVLSDVTQTIGGLVSSADRLAVLTDPDALEVTFRLSVSQYQRLLDENGALTQAPVALSLDTLGADLRGEAVLSRALARVEAGGSGRFLFARVSEASGMQPGDFVTVSIDEPILDNVARLPATAVSAQGDLLVLGEDDRLSAETVDVLRFQGNDVLIDARAFAGREVVSQRSPLIGAGIKIKPLRRDASAQVAEAPKPEMIELSEDRRARLISFVEGNNRMPEAARARVLAQLQETAVSAQLVARIEARMGG